MLKIDIYPDKIILYKLKASYILFVKGEMSMNYKLTDLIEVPKLQSLINNFSDITGLSTTITETDGKAIIITSGWMDLCLKVHRVNPLSKERCDLSKLKIYNELNSGKSFVVMKCYNGLIDVCTKITVNDTHIATIFQGQFFFEEPDLKYFRLQAKEMGIDEESYISLISKVPVVPQNKIEQIARFLTNFSGILAEMGYKQLIQFQLNDLLQQEKDFSNSIISNAGMIILVWKMDGTIIKFNNFAQEITGFSESDIIGKKWMDLLVTLADEYPAEEVFAAIRGGELPYKNEGKFLCKDSRVIDVIWTNNAFFDSEGNKFIVSMGVDITERKKTEQELKISEERFKLALEGSKDVIVDWDMTGNILYMSNRWKELSGYEGTVIEEPYGKLINLVHPEDLKVITTNLNDLFLGKIPYCSYEVRVKMKDGSYKWLLNRGIAKSDAEGRPIRFAGSVTDITNRKEAEEHMNSLAFSDSVTGLSNRTLFIKRLEMLLSNYDSELSQGAVMFLDLDDFKKVNDTYGHSIGDMLLKKIGDRLKSSLRDKDVVARIGGDEFTILLTGVSRKDVVAECANRILNIFKNPWKISGYNFYITASIGITMFPNDGNNVSDVMKNADTAMYSAKDLGKNKYQFFENFMKDKILYKVGLERDLRSALGNEEFVIYYQPQVDIETGKISGMEALLRWDHPSRGIVSPMDFIPTAEEIGLIVPIGEFVLKKACLQNKLWMSENSCKLNISVNVSLLQLMDISFSEKIERILKETGLEPERLELEITESVMMQSVDAVIDTLYRLKRIGIRISLDDFGKGYSSLNYLKQLPIDNLKVDKSFIDDIGRVRHDEVIIEEIIAIAHKLKINVIAEGVETEEQLRYLKEQKCNKAQGYLFSRPLHPVDLQGLLKDRAVIINP